MRILTAVLGLLFTAGCGSSLPTIPGPEVASQDDGDATATSQGRGCQLMVYKIEPLAPMGRVWLKASPSPGCGNRVFSGTTKWSATHPGVVIPYKHDMAYLYGPNGIVVVRAWLGPLYGQASVVLANTGPIKN